MPVVNPLIDTGPLAAILNASDPLHAKCTEAFKEFPSPLRTCWPVITETAYLVRYSLPALRTLIRLIQSNALSILPIGIADLSQIEAILSKYHDQQFQLADACLMYLAEREGIDVVLTLDRRDFGLYRTSAGKPLTLVP